MAGGRLAFGEFVTPDAERDVARALFLQTVQRLVPDVLSSLRDDVLPVYMATHGEVARWRSPDLSDVERARYAIDYGDRLKLCFDPRHVSLWRIVGAAELLEGLALYPDLLQLRGALEAWGERHHLREPWELEAALLQLDLWREYPQHAYPRTPWPTEPEQPKGPDSLRWLALLAGGVGSPLLEHERRFTFEHEGPDPTRRSRRADETDIRAVFEHQLRKHLDHVEELVAVAAGFDRAKEYRSLMAHLEWLVRYHVLEEEWPDVSATAKRDFADGRRVSVTSQQAVESAVKKTAKLLGLALREGRGPGRPAGSRTDPSKLRAGRVSKGTRH